MTSYRQTELLLGALDAVQATRLLKVSSDIALILDTEGNIVDLAVQEGDLPPSDALNWVGTPWVQTVTVESRPKVEAMLRDALASATESRWRQVNHPMQSGTEDLPLMWAAVRIVEETLAGHQTQRIVAFGRSLRATVTLQQRLVEAQQTMERDYWRFREAETRYRHLFQTSSEAVLIVDGVTQKVLEANPAARELCVEVRGKLVGAALSALFAPVAAESVQALLAAARSVGRKDAMRTLLADQRTEVSVGASVFRQDDNAFVLVRLSRWHAAAGEPARRGAARGAGLPTSASASDHLLQAFVQGAADALVFTDVQGRVLSANRAFVALAQLSAEGEARGQMLDRWVGRTGVELGVLIANLRQRGNAGLFMTQVRSEFGGSTDVEIAASLVQQGDEAMLAFAIRNTERRHKSEQAASRNVTRTVGDLTELVGNVPLKEIVSETTDLIEQLCIETALQMTGDKRASAALLLGLSRQSLYVKLRRFGMAGDSAGEDDS